MTEIKNTYSAYGLNIAVPFRLPDLLESDAPADVTMRFGRIDPALIEGAFKDARLYENPGVRVRASKRAMYFEWDRLGKVLVSGGREVVIEPDAETLEEDLHPFLTGPVLSVLLHQRGCFVLHASAVEIGGAGVAFMGAKGFGKSTLAGYLKTRGHRLLSDDIVPLTSAAGGEILTIPGFPRVKLYDDSIEAMGERPDDFPTIHRFVEKRSFQLDKPFSTRPERLRGIYVLSDGEKVEIEQVSAVEGFIEIIKNTHLNRFLEDLDCQKEYFDFCRKLIGKVPVYRLRRPSDLGKLNEALELLKAHASGIGRGGEPVKLAA